MFLTACYKLASNALVCELEQGKQDLNMSAAYLNIKVNI